MSKHWWKITGALFVMYSIIEGFLGKVPALPILHETIRNLYFHVTMWFAMIFVLGGSVVYSIRYLSTGSVYDDLRAEHMASAGILLGLLGITTGSVWARFTWGGWWANDPKLNGAAISLLIYLAYVILRSSMDEEQKRARVAAVYNIFAFVLLIVFLMVYPRLNQVDSLHPGNGGNPAFSSYDLDSNMRLVFYPAVAGWIMMGLWIANLSYRIAKLRYDKLMWQSENNLLIEE
ncbi:MAG: cytochrome c biogenesis protein CcsA [Bacteroidetes bacterium]|nr:cytochrome c biogenesis protein CcsA [Bacteroidota bacterium]